MTRPKNAAATIFLPILIGCIGLTQVSRQPRFALFHTVDVLQLIASGLCFGVALAALLMTLRARRTA